MELHKISAKRILNTVNLIYPYDIWVFITLGILKICILIFLSNLQTNSNIFINQSCTLSGRESHNRKQFPWVIKIINSFFFSSLFSKASFSVLDLLGCINKREMHHLHVQK